MSCAASIPLAYWGILALLIVVAAGWGALELLMWKKSIQRIHEQKTHDAYLFAARVVYAQLERANKAMKGAGQ